MSLCQRNWIFTLNNPVASDSPFLWDREAVKYVIWQMEKGENGKTKISADEHVSPISETGLIFEMLIAGEVYAKDAIGGFFRCTKYTHSDIRTMLPTEGEQVGIATGERIAQWCNGGATLARKPQQPETAKAKCWNLVKDKVSGVIAYRASNSSGVRTRQSIRLPQSIASVCSSRWPITHFCGFLANATSSDLLITKSASPRFCLVE